MEQPKLKPCPFCGVVPEVDGYMDMATNIDYGVVRCANIKCPVLPEARRKTRGMAINAWNRRKG